MGWFLLSLMTQVPAPSGIDMTGGAGWAGWTGTGLLSAVLSWLFFKWMPAWIAMLERKDTAHIEAMKGMAKSHDEAFALAEKDRRADFQVALKTIVDHCEREITTLKKANEESTAVVIDLRMALEEMREVYLKVKGNQGHESQQSK